ncbi:prohibitin family protein [Microcoleus sp. FACHB-831]|uniref:prohibitin family protein n=1 Tax=Microcoleus sp. FACHB-831 TaxID=2692827 RepID=UPI00168873A0|nr:prohibitin family protein [Microcoleus sp. FACHB-831]MBD1923683.1 prohibitin family protein [Microcoleus sp. FACHB-831]
MKSNNGLYVVSILALLLLLLGIFFKPFVIVNAGERGVVMEFGKVQAQVLGEGIHPIIPIVNSVQKLSVRVQKEQIPAKSASKDLQDVYTDVALNWHIVPEKANALFQQIGDANEVVQRIINPAVEEVLKAVMARYTAEEIITKRGEVKAGVDEALTSRLVNYNIGVDDISLVSVHFSDRFSEAVEAKQIAEQDAKRSEFVALKAIKEAEAEVNRAKGQAEAQRLQRETLTPVLLQKQAIEKWDGHFPTVLGGNGALPFINLDAAKLPLKVDNQ